MVANGNDIIQREDTMKTIFMNPNTDQEREADTSTKEQHKTGSLGDWNETKLETNVCKHAEES